MPYTRKQYQTLAFILGIYCAGNYTNRTCGTAVNMGFSSINCTKETITANTISIHQSSELKHTLSACKITVQPTSSFSQAENFILIISNRNALCDRDVWLEDRKLAKNISLCIWKERFLQASTDFNLISLSTDFLTSTSDENTPLIILTAFFRPPHCEYFKCLRSKICIAEEAVCNGEANCLDGSDEAKDSCNDSNNIIGKNTEASNFSKIGIILTAVLLLCIGIILAVVIREKKKEKNRRPPKYEVNAVSSHLDMEAEASFMAEDIDHEY